MRRPFVVGLAAVVLAFGIAALVWRLFPQKPTPRPAATPAVSPKPRPSPVPTAEARASGLPRRPRPLPSLVPAPRPPRLRVTSDVPGASVFLDRKHVGAAPVEIDDVAPGPHRLNVSAEGYEMYGETIEVGETPTEVAVRFKEVRLDEALPVVHKHGLGSCAGRLLATASGLAYETDRKQDAFRLGFDQLEPLEVDYLAKVLRVKQRAGRTFNFTEPGGNADALLVFQKKVEAARARLAAGSQGSGLR